MSELRAGVETGPSAALAALVAGAPLEKLASLLDASASAAGVLELAGDEIRVAYLNPAAAAASAVPAEESPGRTLEEVFPGLDREDVARLLRESEGTPGAVSLRGYTGASGNVWNFDATALGQCRFLVVAQPLTDRLADRQRLEALLEATEVIWRPLPFAALAPQLVEQAMRLLPGLEVAVGEVAPGRPGSVRIVAGNADWIKPGVEVPFDVLASLDRAGTRRLRSIPLTTGEPLADGRPAIGALVFLSRSEAPFSEEQRRLMDRFAKLVSLAAHRSEALVAARENALRLEFALEAAMTLSATLEPREVVSALLRQALEVLDAERATLSRIQGDEIVIEATRSRQHDEATWIGRRYSLSYLDAQPLVRQALSSGRPVIGGQLDARAAAPEFQRALEQVAHTANVPLLSGGRPVALLVMSRRAEEPGFGDSEVATLQLLGNAAMLALRNARLFSEAEDAARRLRVGVETALDVASEVQLEEVVRRLLRRAAELSDADRVTLCTLDGEELAIEDSYDREGGRPIAPGARLRVDTQALLIDAFRAGRTLQASSVNVEAMEDAYQAQIRHLNHFATVPLAFRGEVVGALNLSRVRDEPFTEDQLAQLTQMGQVAVLALRNARLFADLEEASRSKSEFLNLAAHELRTPLTVIMGYVSLLRDGSLGGAPEGWGHILEVIEEKSRELGKLVDSLLVAARLQAGSLATRPAVVDVVELVTEATSRARAAMRLEGAEVVIELPAAPVVATVDPEQVGRILDNLLNNALAYRQGTPWVRIRVLEHDGVVDVDVEDRGRGIPASEHERIFEQFVRVEDPDLGFPPGTGLGLYISRALARRHGGELELVRSEPGQGSLFRLRLPVAGS